MLKFLDFEKPIAELANKIDELKHLSGGSDINIVSEISRLQSKLEKMTEQIYKNLSAWQKVQIARHQDRPKFKFYLNGLIENFLPLAGDRNFGEDCAIIGGIGSFSGLTVMVIGQEKGNDTESRIKHNFGMAKPEGYRKAKRLMELADKFRIPVLSFVDTAGAYPGIEAEERGQAEAIARCIETCLSIKVPIITVVIGEGGSGGAIAIATANDILMLEHSVYSVISPEGCSSILWKNGAKAAEAAEAQKLTAQDLLNFKIIDQIIPEPLGGAHRYPHVALQSVKSYLIKTLRKYNSFDSLLIKENRKQKYLNMGIL
jgi:acetyl-CoA carboxylase carboxyl transferase subunit alpha